ncbi:kyphoscoliosis peptidase-like [Ptychodera flava]|uniref:kyphoscoliosis peptidase-like n=1 Tax=Ptychodera flava TaxID=63121 RepID=UPI00396A54AC
MKLTILLGDKADSEPFAESLAPDVTQPSQNGKSVSTIEAYDTVGDKADSEPFAESRTPDVTQTNQNVEKSFGNEVAHNSDSKSIAENPTPDVTQPNQNEEMFCDNEIVHNPKQSIDDTVSDKSDSKSTTESGHDSEQSIDDTRTHRGIPTLGVKQPSQKYFHIEDTFCKEKRKLIPNYDRMRVLDQHALKAPKRLKNSPKDLVSYLLKPAKNDLERYRLLFRWEAQNVDYDVEGYYSGNYGDNSPEGVLKNGKSVCEGYGGLYKYLCELAGLECVKLSGASKGGDYKPGDVFPIIDGKVKTDHAWNKIKIDGEWYLCDCTWAAGAVGFDKDCGENKYTRCWNEYYFLSDPEMFTSKHFPIDENGNVSAIDQLLKKPFLDLNKWSDVATTDCAYYAYEVETLSHSDGVIETDSNQTSIRIRSPYSIDIWANLSALNGIGQSPRKGQDFEDHVMSYREGDILHFDIRLPRKGRYCVDIGGKPNFADDEVIEMRNSILTYTISGSGEKQDIGFPSGMGNRCWGADTDFTSAGFRVHGLRVPIIRSNAGKVSITVSLPGRRTPLLCKLRHHTESGSEQLQGHFCGEKKGRKARLTLLLPYEGEYRFTIMARLKKNSESFWEGANYLICNTHPLTVEETFPDCDHLWGPNEHFFKMGLHVAGLAVVTVENGDHCLTVRKGSDIDLTCNIERNGTKMPSCIFADSHFNGEEVNFRMRLPEAGFYKFTLYAKKKNQAGSYPGAGQWLIDCKSAWAGELYPDDRGLWGPSDIFFDLGMKAANLSTSLVITEDGQCSLSFSVPDKIVVTGRLERNGVNQDTSLLPEVAIDGTSVTYHMRFREEGLHVFTLFAKKRRKEGSFL